MPFRTSLLCLVAAWPASACAQDIRPESLVQYGGTYSPACNDAAAAKVSITAEGLVIAQGNRALKTAARMDSYTSFGATATSPVPENYRVEFIGDAFSLYVFEDAHGKYVPLAGYVPEAETVVGAAGMAARYRRCN